MMTALEMKVQSEEAVKAAVICDTKRLLFEVPKGKITADQCTTDDPDINSGGTEISRRQLSNGHPTCDGEKKSIQCTGKEADSQRKTSLFQFKANKMSQDDPTKSLETCNCHLYNNPSSSGSKLTVMQDKSIAADGSSKCFKENQNDSHSLGKTFNLVRTGEEYEQVCTGTGSGLKIKFRRRSADVMTELMRRQQQVKPVRGCHSHMSLSGEEKEGRETIGCCRNSHTPPLIQSVALYRLPIKRNGSSADDALKDMNQSNEHNRASKAQLSPCRHCTHPSSHCALIVKTQDYVPDDSRKPNESSKLKSPDNEKDTLEILDRENTNMLLSSPSSCGLNKSLWGRRHSISAPCECIGKIFPWVEFKRQDYSKTIHDLQWLKGTDDARSFSCPEVPSIPRGTCDNLNCSLPEAVTTSAKSRYSESSNYRNMLHFSWSQSSPTVKGGITRIYSCCDRHGPRLADRLFTKRRSQSTDDIDRVLMPLRTSDIARTNYHTLEDLRHGSRFPLQTPCSLAISSPFENVTSASTTTGSLSPYIPCLNPKPMEDSRIESHSPESVSVQKQTREEIANDLKQSASSSVTHDKMSDSQVASTSQFMYNSWHSIDCESKPHREIPTTKAVEKYHQLDNFSEPIHGQQGDERRQRFDKKGPIVVLNRLSSIDIEQYASTTHGAISSAICQHRGVAKKHTARRSFKSRSLKKTNPSSPEKQETSGNLIFTYEKVSSQYRIKDVSPEIPTSYPKASGRSNSKNCEDPSTCLPSTSLPISSSTLIEGTKSKIAKRRIRSRNKGIHYINEDDVVENMDGKESSDNEDVISLIKINGEQSRAGSNAVKRKSDSNMFSKTGQPPHGSSNSKSTKKSAQRQSNSHDKRNIRVNQKNKRRRLISLKTPKKTGKSWNSFKVTTTKREGNVVNIKGHHNNEKIQTQIENDNQGQVHSNNSIQESKKSDVLFSEEISIKVEGQPKCRNSRALRSRNVFDSNIFDAALINKECFGPPSHAIDLDLNKQNPLSAPREEAFFRNYHTAKDDKTTSTVQEAVPDDEKGPSFPHLKEMNDQKHLARESKPTKTQIKAEVIYDADVKIEDYMKSGSVDKSILQRFELIDSHRLGRDAHYTYRNDASSMNFAMPMKSELQGGETSKFNTAITPISVFESFQSSADPSQSTALNSSLYGGSFGSTTQHSQKAGISYWERGHLSPSTSSLDDITLPFAIKEHKHAEFKSSEKDASPNSFHFSRPLTVDVTEVKEEMPYNLSVSKHDPFSHCQPCEVCTYNTVEHSEDNLSDNIHARFCESKKLLNRQIPEIIVTAMNCGAKSESPSSKYCSPEKTHFPFLSPEQPSSLKCKSLSSPSFQNSRQATITDNSQRMASCTKEGSSFRRASGNDNILSNDVCSTADYLSPNDLRVSSSQNHKINNKKGISYARRDETQDEGHETDDSDATVVYPQAKRRGDYLSPCLLHVRRQSLSRSISTNSGKSDIGDPNVDIVSPQFHPVESYDSSARFRHFQTEKTLEERTCDLSSLVCDLRENISKVKAMKRKRRTNSFSGSNESSFDHDDINKEAGTRPNLERFTSVEPLMDSDTPYENISRNAGNEDEVERKDTTEMLRFVAGLNLRPKAYRLQAFQGNSPVKYENSYDEKGPQVDHVSPIDTRHLTCNDKDNKKDNDCKTSRANRKSLHGNGGFLRKEEKRKNNSLHVGLNNENANDDPEIGDLKDVDKNSLVIIDNAESDYIIEGNEAINRVMSGKYTLPTKSQVRKMNRKRVKSEEKRHSAASAILKQERRKAAVQKKRKRSNKDPESSQPLTGSTQERKNLDTATSHEMTNDSSNLPTLSLDAVKSEAKSGKAKRSKSKSNSRTGAEMRKPSGTSSHSKEKRGVSNPKKSDLLKLCHAKVITDEVHKWYEDLPSSTTARIGSLLLYAD